MKKYKATVVKREVIEIEAKTPESARNKLKKMGYEVESLRCVGKTVYEQSDYPIASDIYNNPRFWGM